VTPGVQKRPRCAVGGFTADIAGTDSLTFVREGGRGEESKQEEETGVEEYAIHVCHWTGVGWRDYLEHSGLSHNTKKDEMRTCCFLSESAKDAKE